MGTDMRKYIGVLLCVLLGMVMGFIWRSQDVSGQDGQRKNVDRPFVNILAKVRTAQRFVEDSKVSPEDIQAILRAGMSAPSAHNRQPWHFAVVTNQSLMKEIDQKAGVEKSGRLYLSGAAVAIVVSGDLENSYARFDCGTATDRMSVAALALGYGTKIVGSPAETLEKCYREKLGIPEKKTPVAVLLIGVEETPADTTSGATTRNAFDETVRMIP